LKPAAFKFGAALALASPLLATSVQAEVVTQKDGKWRGLVGVSVAFTTGNTVTNSALLNLDVARQTSHTKVSLLSFLNQATSKVNQRTQTTADKWGAAGQYDSDLDLRWFAFGKLRFEGDRLLALTLRSTLSSGLGYHVVDVEGHSLNVFSGLTYTDSKYARPQAVNGRFGQHFAGPGAILGEESTHRFNDRVNIKQRLELYPDGSGDEAHIGRFNSSLNVSMSETLSLSLNLVSVYTHNVPPNAKKTDTSVFTGINIKLGP
jgi:putative salt-induced outer membrane protein